MGFYERMILKICNKGDNAIITLDDCEMWWQNFLNDLPNEHRLFEINRQLKLYNATMNQPSLIYRGRDYLEFESEQDRDWFILRWS